MICYQVKELFLLCSGFKKEASTHLLREMRPAGD
jgi:hypothetical protein